MAEVRDLHGRMRPLTRVGLLVALLACSACEQAGQAGGADTFTLYRNRSAGPQLRVHYATFDADESSSTYNMANCRMAARLLNANIRKLNDDRQPAGFWCEPGGFSEAGERPTSFDAAFPTDS